MPNTWDEIAHSALEDNTSQPVQADATNIVKYGAPSVAVITAVLTAILGASWKVDPTRPAVLFSTAIVIAAVVVGIYYAFGSDVRTRGAVTIARYEAISRLATATTTPAAANGAAPSLQPSLAVTQAQLDACNKRVTAVTDNLVALQAQHDQVLGQLRDTEAQLAEAKNRPEVQQS
ncbi:MAG: hypothetical protein ACTHMY_05110 [Solirubrobacteraceae bacterium]